MNRYRITLVSVMLLFIMLAACTSSVRKEAGLSPKAELGKAIFFDKIAMPKTMACADCHSAETGFTGPDEDINARGTVYAGSMPERFGNRKPPTAAYATFAPVFHYDEEESLFVGGSFWNGRATGEELGNPAADQAMAPFLNPVEHNNATKRDVLQQIAAAGYIGLWEEAWGEPIAFGTDEEIERDFGRAALSIAAFEASKEVNRFSSKFDEFWEKAQEKGLEVPAIDMTNWKGYTGLGLTDDEVRGLALFADVNKGMCAECHVLDPAGEGLPPVFTDFTYDNIGVPKNPENPFYRMDKVFLDDGTPVNPEGAEWIDRGLAEFLETRPEWKAMAAGSLGKHKVPTLRNVDLRPRPGFVKAYVHNGFFKSLKDVVSFYNTRDVKDWGPPEVAENVNTDELGDLGLTDEEEDLIVLFMQTLSDGYESGVDDDDDDKKDEDN